MGIAYIYLRKLYRHKKTSNKLFEVFYEKLILEAYLSEQPPSPPKDHKLFHVLQTLLASFFFDFGILMVCLSVLSEHSQV
jgi:hypothetical protein